MEEQKRRRGRPPANGEKYGRLYVNVGQGTITALALEAQRRGTTLSELTRLALADWMRRGMPVGEMPHEADAVRTGVETPVPVEHAAYGSDGSNRGKQ